MDKTKFWDGDRLSKLAFSRAGGALVESSVAIGSVLSAEHFFPDVKHKIIDAVDKNLVAPHLAMFEKLADKWPSLEGRAGQIERRALGDAEKSNKFATALVRFASIEAVESAVQSAAVSCFEHKIMGLPKVSGTAWERQAKHMPTFVATKTVHLLTFIATNTVLLKQSEHMQAGLSSFLQTNLGQDKKSADDYASVLVNWTIPELFALPVTLLMANKMYQHG